MNKFLMTLATLVAFALSSVAHAEMKVSGFMQQIIGMGDQVDGGINYKFNRFSFGADTTTDNGWTVGGSFAMEYGSIGTGANSGYLPTSNSMYIQTDMATITIGSAADAVTALMPRVSAMVPGGGHDGGYQFLFDGGSIANNGVNFAEAYYAMANNRINVALPSVNGFTVNVSYTPDMGINSATGISRTAANATESASHGETSHVAIQYSGEMDGISYTIGLGSINGNSIGTNGTAATSTNNDLSSFTGAIKMTMGNIAFGVMAFDNGDSWGQAEDADKADHSGYNVQATYNMGNISVGVGYAHEEKALGTARATSAQAGNLVAEDSVTMIGLGYDMGGGVNSYIQLSNGDHTDGDHSTTEVDPQVLFMGISLGF
ncbi:MAG: hypothetical protein CMJ05_03730 [Pelagibacterales bacterium]|nr:hypothetical protein [Pelagibacterales bacterium]